MNNLYKKILLLLCSWTVCISVNAQNSHAPLEDMVNAIKTNNMQDMDRYMESFVTININNIQAIYSHNQAQIILHDFFEKNDPKEMLLVDSGEPSTASAFAIGTYNTPVGNKYTVYVLMKLKNSKYVLQEIRVNKE